MRKILACLTAAFALLVGYNVAPAAAAFYLPPYTPYNITVDGCTLEFIYGTYGDVGFAQIRALTGGCSGNSGVQVTTVSGGKLVGSRHCTYNSEIVNNYPDCEVSNGGATLMAFRSGPMFAGEALLVCGATSCNTGWIPFSPFA